VVYLTGINACGNTCDSDADSDGVCDDVDVCLGFNDAEDADLDAIPDGCDACPEEASNDADGNGICDASPVTALEGIPGGMAVLQRSQNNEHALHISGTLQDASVEKVILELDQDDVLLSTLESIPSADGIPTFDFDLSLSAGLHDYTLRINTVSNGLLTRATTRFDVAVGDLFMIQGQSNAVAADYAGEGLANENQSRWIRSFGSASTDPVAVESAKSWIIADGLSAYGEGSIGAWGLRMAKQLVDKYAMPIGVLNGAVGGTYIEQHLRNDDNPEDLNTIYGRFLYRARRSGFDSGAKYLVWYQGESDGDGWGSDSLAAQYSSRFERLHAAWLEDFSALNDFYVFQVRYGCGLDHFGDATLQLNYLNANGVSLGTESRLFWTGPTWNYFETEGATPEGTATVRISLLPIAYGAIQFDDASLSLESDTELLNNPGFETGMFVPETWLYRGQGAFSWTQSGAHGGSRAVQLEAQADSATMLQDVPIPGTGMFVGGVWARNTFGDSWVDVREDLRDLSRQYDHLEVMSTNGAPGHDTCHFAYEGYRELGDRLFRLIDVRQYGAEASVGILPPSPRKVKWEGDDLVVTLDNAELGSILEPGVEENFMLEGTFIRAARLEADNRLVLTPAGPSNATVLSYSVFQGTQPDLLGPQGVGMLDFVDFPISSP
jgi:hypothetical protein